MEDRANEALNSCKQSWGIGTSKEARYHHLSGKGGAF